MSLPPQVKMLSVGELTSQGSLVSFEYVTGGRIAVLLTEPELRYLRSMADAVLTKIDAQRIANE